MAGTTPLSIHKPISIPTMSRITIACILSVIELRALFSSSLYGIFSLKKPTNAASMAAKNNAIWFGPYDELSLKKNTFKERPTTKNKIGANDNNSPGFFILLKSH